MEAETRVRVKMQLKILDGGLATELEKRGYSIDDSLWSAKALLDSPELLQEISQSYVDAGADIVCSAGYQLTIEALKKKGKSLREIREIFEKSISILPTCEVAVSIGSYGAMLADGSEYRGEYSIDRKELRAFHEKRIELYQSILDERGEEASSHIQWFGFETIPNNEECKTLIDLAESRVVQNYWISVSLRDSQHLSDGTPIKQWARQADRMMAERGILGINCVPPSWLKEALEEIRGVTDRGILVYPNRGDVYDPATKTWIENSKTSRSKRPWAEFVTECLSFQLTAVGGCCGTGPSDIRALKAMSKSST